MTSLYRQALTLYKGDRLRMARDLERIISLPEGKVAITNGLMLWGFPVRIGDTLPDHIEIEHHDDPDAWMVWLAAGELTADAVRNAIPYPLPRVIFARDNRLRCYNLEMLLHHLP